MGVGWIRNALRGDLVFADDPACVPEICRFCLVALLVITVGCSHDAAAPAGPATEYNVDALVFEPPELKQSFQTFTAVAREFCRDGFSHRPFRAGGNFISAQWTKGGDFGSDILFRKGAPQTEDVHQVFVTTRCLPAPPREGQAADPTRPDPVALESLIAVTFVPRDPKQWCVSWGYNHKPSRLGGTYGDWHVRFCRWDPARLDQPLLRPLQDVREDVAIPLRLYSGIGRRWGAAFERPETRPDDFFRRMKSADAMRDAQLADLDRFEGDVLRRLDDGGVTKFVPTEESHDGMPPPGKQVPLTDIELAAERKQVKDYFAAQRTTIRDHCAAMYTAFRNSFPVEKCCPEFVVFDQPSRGDEPARLK